MSGSGSDDPSSEVLADCTGLLCPMPIYRAAMALAKMARGDILAITATDPGALKDFPALARQQGHELLETRQTAPGVWLFRLKKGGRT